MTEADVRAPVSPAPRAWSYAGPAATAVLVFVSFFLIYGQRWLMGESVFRGVVQEQYFLIGQYAFEHKILEDFSAGRFPLWNEYNALGTPLLGNMLSGAFYPLKVIIYFFPSLAARDFYLILRLLIGALLAHALARRFKLSEPACVLAALAFSLTGYFKMFINENYLNADILLPGIALVTLRLNEKRKVVDLALLYLLIFALLNNGHPEAAFYALLFAAWLALMAGKTKEAPKRLLLFAAAFIPGFILSLPMLLPFIEYWGRGYHFHLPDAGFFHYPARQIAAVFSPWFFGEAPAGAAFLGDTALTWTEAGTGIPPYSSTSVPWLFPALGGVPLLLAIIGASRLKVLSRAEAAMAAFSVFFLGVTFGLPGFNLAGYLPVFSFSGNFKHPIPALALTAAILAGRGLDSVLEKNVNGIRVALITGLFIAITLLLGIFHQPIGDAGFLNFHSALILLVTAACGAWLARLPGGRPAAAGPALFAWKVLCSAPVIASAIFCLALDGRQQPMRDPGYEARLQAGHAYEKLLSLEPLDRVYISQDIAPPNLNILFGIADLRVMDGINDRRLVEAVNKINGHTRETGGTYWYRTVGYLQPMPEKLGHPLLRLFNVAYALTDGPLPYNNTIAEFVKRTGVIAPARGYIGRTRLAAQGGEGPGLLQHPPSLIYWPETEAAGFRRTLRFTPGATDKIRDAKSGVFLAVRSSSGLAYARFFHPGLRMDDAQIPSTTVNVECWREDHPEGCDSILLSSTPLSSTIDYNQAGWFDLHLSGIDPIEPSGMDLFASGPTWLYHDPEALPRAFLADYAVAASESEALDRLARGGERPERNVLISSPGFVAEPSTWNGGPGEVNLDFSIRAIDYSSQRIRLGVGAERNGWLVLSDLYYSGWQAEIDGKPARILRGDFLLRALPLPAGAKEVVFTYRPQSFNIGLWSAIATLLFSAWPAYALLRKPPAPLS